VTIKIDKAPHASAPRAARAADTSERRKERPCSKKMPEAETAAAPRSAAAPPGAGKASPRATAATSARGR
jgi:hypothetical protein